MKEMKSKGVFKRNLKFKKKLDWNKLNSKDKKKREDNTKKLKKKESDFQSSLNQSAKKLKREENMKSLNIKDKKKKK